MPTHNEAANLRELMPRILQQAGEIATHELHLLVVDDNSPAGSGSVVADWAKQDPGIHLLNGEKLSIGDAYKRGIGPTYWCNVISEPLPRRGTRFNLRFSPNVCETALGWWKSRSCSVRALMEHPNCV